MTEKTRCNLVLTGFMGTGKTAAGRLAARRLGREFVDMDQRLAEREGVTVAEIFRRRGEAYFRERERELCAELAAQEGLVIATGGGALIDPRSRALFSNAIVICLDASVDEILRRLSGLYDRPLLNGPTGASASGSDQVDRRAQVQELLARRREAYKRIRLHVNTNGRTVEEVAEDVVRLFEATAGRGADDLAGPRELRLDVRTPDGSYPIYLGAGMLDRLGGLLRGELAARCALVTNPTVGALYAEQALDSLRAAGFDPVRVEMPDGEAYKNLDTLRDVYDRLAAARLERRSAVIALGGGVVGDLAGLAAATFLRGVPFVQVPTTLLAMVDASVGGKVAVDHPAGKNLIGAFKFPRLVLADPDVLSTLPVEEYRSGMAEVAKHAVLGDAGLFDELCHRPLDAELLARALRVKIAVVERDPFEQGERAHLNLGHTFGHALETLSGYTLRHGEAVAIGACVAARLAARIGWCDAETRERIVALFAQLGLPTRLPREYAAAQIAAAMGTDKKIRDGKLRLILPRAIGEVGIAENVDPREIAGALEESC